MPRNERKDYSYSEVEDTSIINEEYLMPSTIETIDYAVYDWLNEDLNIFATTNKGWKKIPIVWSSPERAAFRKDKEARDKDGVLILPVISIERQSISKEISKRGKFYSPIQSKIGLQDGTITIARRIKQEKTSNFATKDAYRSRRNVDSPDRNRPRNNKKVVYETISIPIPTYMEMTYNITVQTEYQQQMNEIMSSFLAFERPGPDNYFTVKRDGHRYESFFDPSFNVDNNIANLEEEERTYKTAMTLNTLGYIFAPDENGNGPKISKRENAVEFKFNRERVIVGDQPEHIGKEGFYKP
jgi:hypothetical protein